MALKRLLSDLRGMLSSGYQALKRAGAAKCLVCYTAVFSVVRQRSSPLSVDERCVTTLKTAV